MGDRTLAGLAFFLFQAVTAILFLRPAELFPGLEGLPIYEALMLACMVLAGTEIPSHFRKQALIRQPITLCLIGMFGAILLSHAQHLYLGGVAESANGFFRTAIYYALLVAIVNSPRRLEAYLLNLTVSMSLMCCLCLLDFWEILDFPGIVHLQDMLGHDDEGQPLYIIRMRGLGIFQDPNDLSMAIVAAGTLCLYQLTNRAFGLLHFGWIVPILFLTAALFETKSRGGLLAAGCAALTLSQFWFGPRVAIAFALAGGAAIPVIAGRSGELDFEDGGTAHERILMWREGFHALKSTDFFFGVGQGMYAEVADLVAHNSFVHAFVELGTVGGTFFFGCFFFAAVQLYRIGQLSDEVWVPELQRMRPYLAALLAGWCGSMFSLSRCYVVPTYLVIGLMAAYANLAWIHTDACRPLLIWNRALMYRLVFASGLAFIGLYVFTVVYT